MSDFNAKNLLTLDQITRSPEWLVAGYSEALDRIIEEYMVTDDHLRHRHGPYWVSEPEYFTTPGDTTVYEMAGSEWTPAQARQLAFDLLVQSDLAEAQASANH